MKTALMLILVVGLGYLTWPRLKPAIARLAWFRGDPVAEMKVLAQNFPSEIHTADGRWRRLANVQSRVQKSGSSSAPTVGVLDFSDLGYLNEPVRYELVFYWEEKAWTFQRLLCLTLTVNRPALAAAMESSPEIQSFITHGKVVREEVQAALVQVQTQNPDVGRPQPAKPGSWMWNGKGGTSLDQRPRR